MLARRTPAQVALTRAAALHPATVEQARRIVDEVRAESAVAVRRWGVALGDIAPDAPLVLDRVALRAGLDRVPASTRALLERTADRIRAFAEAQRRAIGDVTVPVPGGRAGHRVMPLDAAGCYAPGGRFPLPSSVLMTAVTARAAGVGQVWVASPRPAPEAVAAAAIAGADGMLCVGGAQAIAALAYGADAVPPCAVVVGPGNRWVTAAKFLVSEHVRIDMLAGPSELLVVADDTASAETVAADLLAQAEHDPDAIPLLVTTDATLADAVDRALATQLESLPTRETAEAALRNGFTVVVASIDEAIAIADRLAPEHLQILTRDAPAVAARCSAYGGIFVGHDSAEVMGDYGAGPNHTLPTGGTARHTGGLSVFDFLAIRTWLQLDHPEELAEDAARLGRLEGLEAHARAADRRLGAAGAGSR